MDSRNKLNFLTSRSVEVNETTYSSLQEMKDCEVGNMIIFDEKLSIIDVSIDEDWTPDEGANLCMDCVFLSRDSCNGISCLIPVNGVYHSLKYRYVE